MKESARMYTLERIVAGKATEYAFDSLSALLFAIKNQADGTLLSLAGDDLVLWHRGWLYQKGRSPQYWGAETTYGEEDWVVIGIPEVFRVYVGDAQVPLASSALYAAYAALQTLKPYTWRRPAPEGWYGVGPVPRTGKSTYRKSRIRGRGARKNWDVAQSYLDWPELKPEPKPELHYRSCSRHYRPSAERSWKAQHKGRKAWDTQGIRPTARSARAAKLRDTYEAE